jgi:hypothetical protein
MQRPVTLADTGASTTRPEANGPVLVWNLRGADGGAAGLEFARATIEMTESVLVHAAPSVLDVEVFENGQRLIAAGKGLRASVDTPMARLRLEGVRVLREQVWPVEEDVGSIVLLPGGEAGRLESWATDPKQRRWVWSVQLRGGEN